MHRSAEDEAQARIARTRAWRSACIIVALGILVIAGITRTLALVLVVPGVLLILDRIRLAHERDLRSGELGRAPSREVRVPANRERG